MANVFDQFDTEPNVFDQFDDVPRVPTTKSEGFQASPDLPAIPGDIPGLYPGAVVQSPEAIEGATERQFPGQSVIEPALTILSGAIAEPVAGAVGLTNLPFTGADDAADLVRSLQEAMTYVPRGTKSMENLQKIAGWIEPVAKAVETAETASGEAGFEAAGPVGGAIGKATPAAAIEALGLGAIRRATRSSKRAQELTEASKREPLTTPEGRPTEIMDEALQKEGLKWDEISPDTQDVIMRQEIGTNPEDVARMARFEEIQSPYFKGQITKDFKQRKMEQGLLESTTEGAAEPMRQTQLAQSEAIKRELGSVINGATGEPGTFVKKALGERKKALRAERKANYDILAENARNYEGFELSPNAIIEGMPERGIMKDIGGMEPEGMNTLDNLLNEFGIIDPTDIDGFLKSGGDIEPLSLGNFERFRKRLNQIVDLKPGMAAVILPIKRALDDEIDLATDSLEGVGGDIAEAAKAARQSHIALKQEFDPAKMTSKLIDSVKRGSDKAKIEGSQVMQKITSPSTPIEEVDRVMDSLRKAGPDGHRAIREMQGRAVLDLLDSAFSAQSRQVAGTRVFGATPYSKQFEKLRPKLESIFKGDPAGFKRIENVYKMAQDIIPPAGAIPKGSAGWWIDALTKTGLYSLVGKAPGMREGMEALRKAGESATARKNVKKSLQAKPGKQKRLNSTLNMIKRDYPQLAVVLGIGELLPDEDQ